MPCDHYPWCIVPNSTAPSPTLDTGPHWIGTSLGPGMEVTMWPLPMMPIVSQRSCGDSTPSSPDPALASLSSSYKVPLQTCSNLFNLDLTIQGSAPDMVNLTELESRHTPSPPPQIPHLPVQTCSLCSPDCRQAGSWHSTDVMPSNLV